MHHLLLTLKVLKSWFPVSSIKGRTLWNWLQSKHDDIETGKSEYQIALGILQYILYPIQTLRELNGVNVYFQQTF